VHHAHAAFTIRVLCGAVGSSVHVVTASLQSRLGNYLTLLSRVSYGAVTKWRIKSRQAVLRRVNCRF
jgi:hypothetical protein